MKTITTAPKRERFRVIESQTFVNFPENIDPLTLKIIGTFQGEGKSIEPLTIAHFDSITFNCISEGIKTKNKVIHALGYRKEIPDRLTLLIIELPFNI